MDYLNLLWVLLILILLQPRARPLAAREGPTAGAPAALEQRDATVITPIHRQETVSFLGIP